MVGVKAFQDGITSNTSTDNSEVNFQGFKNFNRGTLPNGHNAKFGLSRSDKIRFGWHHLKYDISQKCRDISAVLQKEMFQKGLEIKKVLEMIGGKKDGCSESKPPNPAVSQGPVCQPSLEKIMDKQREDGGIDLVPKFIKEATDYLKANCYKTEGIFRVPGNTDDIIALQNEWNSGKPFDEIQVLNDENIEKTHLVASAFKRYLRQMPEPVINNGDRFLEWGRSEERSVDELKRLVNDLPGDNRNLLHHLVQMFEEIDSHSDTNKMKLGNLVMVFSPAIFGDQAVSNLETVGTYTNVLMQIAVNHAAIWSN